MLMTDRSLLLRGSTVTVLALACVLPSLAPAAHAARVDPNSPKGKWSGTYQDEDGVHSGNVTLTISKLKAVPGSAGMIPNGSMKLGAAKGKLGGIYSSAERLLTVATMVRRGTAGSIAVTLSQDGNTLTGTYGTNSIPDGGNQHEGTITLSRK